MSTLIRFCVVAMISSWMIPATILAAPSPASKQQATPSPAADPVKQTSAPAKPHQPRPNPDADGNYHVGDGVTAPILVHSEEPNIPKNMRKSEYPRKLSCGPHRRHQRNSNGYPYRTIHPRPQRQGNARHRNGSANFCIEAAEKYRFQPATFQGKPVPVILRVEISYQKKF
jgi:hypothetical protein